MTRHELKEQLQHDHFTDAVSQALEYTQTHRALVLRWVVGVLAVLVVAAGAYWYSSYRSSVRKQDLDAAFAVLDASVGAPNAVGRNFATTDAKRQASLQALSNVIAKDGGSREGWIAQYYRGTLRAQAGDTKGAQADLEAVQASGSSVASLAKLALAGIYAGQNRYGDAQKLVRDIINKPTGLVSKGQAELSLARLEETTNPQDAKRIVQSLQGSKEDPAVSRAAEEISADLNK